MRVWEAASRVKTLGLNGGWSPEDRNQQKPMEWKASEAVKASLGGDEQTDSGHTACMALGFSVGATVVLMAGARTVKLSCSSSFKYSIASLDIKFWKH